MLVRKEKYMYYKKCFGRVLVQKSIGDPVWVEWIHHSEGIRHCATCLKLDKCWFEYGNVPENPHHPHCHCELRPLDYSLVRAAACAQSDYSKFDPYLFDLKNDYKHGKNRAFESWGYSIQDSRWLKAEFEKQALEKYLDDDYTLGKLNGQGQRITIRVEIPRKDKVGEVSFQTGWMVEPRGRIRLTTPYGGK